jgi:hypothetical protein
VVRPPNAGAVRLLDVFESRTAQARLLAISFLLAQVGNAAVRAAGCGRESTTRTVPMVVAEADLGLAAALVAA